MRHHLCEGAVRRMVRRAEELDSPAPISDKSFSLIPVRRVRIRFGPRHELLLVDGDQGLAARGHIEVFEAARVVDLLPGVYDRDIIPRGDALVLAAGTIPVQPTRVQRAFDAFAGPVRVRLEAVPAAVTEKRHVGHILGANTRSCVCTSATTRKVNIRRAIG